MGGEAMVEFCGPPLLELGLLKTLDSRSLGGPYCLGFSSHVFRERVVIKNVGTQNRSFYANISMLTSLPRCWPVFVFHHLLPIPPSYLRVLSHVRKRCRLSRAQLPQPVNNMAVWIHAINYDLPSEGEGGGGGGNHKL